MGVTTRDGKQGPHACVGMQPVESAYAADAKRVVLTMGMSEAAYGRT